MAGIQMPLVRESRCRWVGAVQMREVRAGTSYLSQDDLRLHFGLGAATQADHLVVRWPDGVEERLDGGGGQSADHHPTRRGPRRRRVLDLCRG